MNWTLDSRIIKLVNNKKYSTNHDQELNYTGHTSCADHTDANTHTLSLPYEERKFEKLVISDTGRNNMKQ